MDHVKRIEELEKENAELRRIVEARICRLEKETIYMIQGEITYIEMMKLRNFMVGDHGIRFVVSPRDISLRAVQVGPPLNKL